MTRSLNISDCWNIRQVLLYYNDKLTSMYEDGKSLNLCSTIGKNTDRNMIVLTLGFGGKDSACFGSRDWPETPSFFRCVSVPEYCSCTRENIRIKIGMKYVIKLEIGSPYIYVSCVAVMMNINLFLMNINLF